MRTRKEIYCENCGSNQPMIEHEPQKDELNPYPWYADVDKEALSRIIGVYSV